MKRHILFTLLAALLAACTQNELADTASTATCPLQIASATIARSEGDAAAVAPEGTGTVDGTWMDGDKITVNYASNMITSEYTYSDGAFSSDDPIDLRGQPLSQPVKAYTSYPYVPSNWKVETDQSGEGYRKSDFLYGSSSEYVSSANPNVNFTLKHQTAKIEVHVRNAGIVQGASGLGMTVGDNNNIYVSGRWSYTPSDDIGAWQETNANAGDTKGTIIPYNLGARTMSDGSTSLVSFGALVIPQTIAGGEKLFAFTYNGETYYYTIPAGSSIKWEPAQEYTYNVTIGGKLEVTSESVVWSTGNTGSGSVTVQ